MAQGRPPLDREVQHERVCHQRTSTQLGRSCCQIGLQRDLCEGLEVSRTPVVEMATASLERSGEGQMVWSVPKTIQTQQMGGHGVAPSLPETQMALQNQSKIPRVGSNLLKIVGVGDSLQILDRAWSWCSQCWCETEIHQMPRGPKCVRHAGGHSLLLAWTGVVWRWWRRLAPIGVEWWSRPRKITIDREKESERFGEHLASFSLYASRLDVDVSAGESAARSKWICRKCRMESWRFGVKSNEKVLSWNVLRRSDDKTDQILAQIWMLTEWDAGKIEVNGAYELFTPGKLSEVQNSEMGGQLETVLRERAGGLQLGEMVVEMQRLVAGFDGFRWLRWLRWLRWIGGVEWSRPF